MHRGRDFLPNMPFHVPHAKKWGGIQSRLCRFCRRKLSDGMELEETFCGAFILSEDQLEGKCEERKTLHERVGFFFLFFSPEKIENDQQHFFFPSPFFFLLAPIFLNFYLKSSGKGRVYNFFHPSFMNISNARSLAPSRPLSLIQMTKIVKKQIRNCILTFPISSATPCS